MRRLVFCVVLVCFLTISHLAVESQACTICVPYPDSTLADRLLENSGIILAREQIYQFLGNFRFIEWHSLYILFLGQSSHPDDHAFIRQRVESSVRLTMTTNLAAWLTAFIETNPETGVTEIETWYFSNPGRSRDELEQVMTSMSVLGSLPPLAKLPLFLFREKIVKSYGTLLKNYPEMASRVAKDLAMWQVKAHVYRLSAIQKANTLAEPSEVYLLDYYLSMAKNYPRMVHDGLD